MSDLASRFILAELPKIVGWKNKLNQIFFISEAGILKNFSSLLLEFCQIYIFFVELNL